PKGRIYILANPALKGLVKIGKTERSADERAAELSSTGLPQRYFVAYETVVSDCDAAEREIHKELLQFRLTDDREFFEMTLQEAIEKVDTICDRFFDDPSGRSLDNRDDLDSFVSENGRDLSSAMSPLVTRPLRLDPTAQSSKASSREAK